MPPAPEPRGVVGQRLDEGQVDERKAEPQTADPRQDIDEHGQRAGGRDVPSPSEAGEQLAHDDPAEAVRYVGERPARGGMEDREDDVPRDECDKGGADAYRQDGHRGIS
jgi:hypothetical protein